MSDSKYSFFTFCHLQRLVLSLKVILDHISAGHSERLSSLFWCMNPSDSDQEETKRICVQCLSDALLMYCTHCFSLTWSVKVALELFMCSDACQRRDQPPEKRGSDRKLKNMQLLWQKQPELTVEVKLYVHSFLFFQGFPFITFPSFFIFYLKYLFPAPLPPTA